MVLAVMSWLFIRRRKAESWSRRNDWHRPMKYISTRGAPHRSDLSMSCWLASRRDGGLYVPEQWPRLTAGRVARPAWQVLCRCRLCRAQAVRRRRDRRCGLAPDDRRGLCAASRHKAVVPLKQLDANHWLMELFHGPDAGLQGRGHAAAGAADGPCAARSAAAAPPSSAQPPATPAAPPSRRFADVHAHRHLHPASRMAACRDVQRRQMTTVGKANVHNIALEGTFDDCQAHVKAMFADAPFPRPRAAVRRQLDQLGAHHGPDRLLLHRRPGAGRAGPAGQLLRADRQFRRHLRRLRGAPHGPADRRTWSSPPTSTTSCTHPRDRPLRGAGRRADHKPVHGHPGVEQLRAPAVRGGGQGRRRGAPADGRA